MLQVRINLDDAGLRNLMARWMVKKRKTVEDGLLIAARTLCKAFMDFSLPRDNLKMERLVKSDIHRAYAGPSDVFRDIRQMGDEETAKAFWAFYQTGKYKRAEKIMQAKAPAFAGLKIQPFDGGSAHKAARGARGHVVKNAKPSFVIKDGSKKGKLSRYIANKQANVGMVKAGWVAAWRDLGRVREVPKWVSRIKGSTYGSAEMQLQGQTSQHILIHNAVRHADEAIDQRYQNTIEAVAADRLAKFFKKQLGLIQNENALAA
jgi:hypothetical protein